MTTSVRVAVLPAGGLGTRLLPVTRSVPKELLPLVDTPIIEKVVEDVVAAGVDEVVIVTSPGKDALRTHFTAAPELASRLRRDGRTAEADRVERAAALARFTFVEQREPLGNGHAVLLAREAVGPRPFLMIWPDDLVISEPPVAVQLVRARERLGGGSVAAAQRVPLAEAPRYGIVSGEQLDDRTWRVRALVEKPERPPSDVAVLHGYLLEPEIFDVLAEQRPGKGGEIWLTDAVSALAGRAPVHAYLYDGERYDAGDRLGYVRAVVTSALARPDLAGPLRDWLRRVTEGRPTEDA
ncbi:MAG TPA: UTP--glucose-1-phosphate uridylyltransferase [Candidatus Limnocylindria bacterium]|nr:UTP--glucose-1-phosphate uridylyltransferase [Candidatus Limnocylindria bacterium]